MTIDAIFFGTWQAAKSIIIAGGLQLFDIEMRQVYCVLAPMYVLGAGPHERGGLMYRAIIYFGDEQQFLRIEGAELPVKPNPGDMIHIDASRYGFDFTLEVDFVDYLAPDGLIIGAKVVDEDQELIKLIVGKGAPLPVPIVEMCIWTSSKDGINYLIWESGCQEMSENLFEPTMGDDGPLDWGWQFCPKCGGPIAQRRTDAG
jgi:hypothetical protein